MCNQQDSKQISYLEKCLCALDLSVPRFQSRILLTNIDEVTSACCHRKCHVVILTSVKIFEGLLTFRWRILRQNGSKSPEGKTSLGYEKFKTTSSPSFSA